MIVKLRYRTVNLKDLKGIYNKPRVLYCGFGKKKRFHYHAEYLNGDCFVLTKQEYKLLKKEMDKQWAKDCA